jgi:methionyl-tRNA synthetase
MTNDGKFYLTTPIYYVNAPPHMGHIYTTVLADVLARYQRLLGKEVFFLTGTDEHGAKVKRAADKIGQEVEKFVDKNARTFKEAFKLLDISNSDFIRTSDRKKHWPAVEKMWRAIDKAGDLYKSVYQGLYCTGCEAFITEKDLIDGKCKLHNETPEVLKEENYFFKLSRYSDRLEKTIKSGELEILPEARRNEILSFIAEGLTDVSFSRPSRDIKWGIPVPEDPDQTIYVWCDALVNYLSGVGYGRDDLLFKKFWPADLHVLGKDILRFHAVIWPAMLFSAKLPLPKKLLVHGHILSGGKKMSKTLGNIVEPFNIVSEYGVDALRHYLTLEISPFSDGDFTEDKFKSIYNANLANGLGNLVSRVFKMVHSYFGGYLKRPDDLCLSQVPLKERGKESFSLVYLFDRRFWPVYKKSMVCLETHRAAGLIWSVLSALDNYIQIYKPFNLINNDRDKAAAVLWSLLFGLANISWMLYPFLPKTAKIIMDKLGIAKNLSGWREFKLEQIDQPLFRRK